MYHDERGITPQERDCQVLILHFYLSVLHQVASERRGSLYFDIPKWLDVATLNGKGDENPVLPKGLGDMAGLMKKAMQMKASAEKMKAELANETVDASVGGGMVTVTMNGGMQVLAVKIDPEIIDKDDPEQLETLVQAAVNECVGKIQELVKAKMKEVTGGMDIPGLT